MLRNFRLATYTLTAFVLISFFTSREISRLAQEHISTFGPSTGSWLWKRTLHYRTPTTYNAVPCPRCVRQRATDNVQQTTCNNFFKSSSRLFHFSFLYVICGTWELYLYNFPWFDTTKLCSCALQLDFSPLFRSSGELLMTHLLPGVRGDHLIISLYHINKF